MLNLHPHYGLENVTRYHILREAERLGVAEASKLYGVHQSSIYKWRKVMEACPLPTLAGQPETPPPAPEPGYQGWLNDAQVLEGLSILAPYDLDQKVAKARLMEMLAALQEIVGTDDADLIHSTSDLRDTLRFVQRIARETLENGK